MGREQRRTTFGLLGPLEVRAADGALVDVGGRQPRLVLGLLLAARSWPVTADALVDALWGDAPPPSAAGTLQSYISRLRRHVAAAGGGELTHDDAGYRLIVADGALDVDRFQELATAGRARLAAGDAAAARAHLVEADALWRGPALIDLLDVEGVIALATRLDEQRLAAIADRVDADLALGRHDAAVADLVALVVAHPLRESFATRLALALYRGGRQADALRTLAATSAMLRDELGIEPSTAVRELEAAILAHAPALDAPIPSPPRPPGTPASRAPAPAANAADSAPPRIIGRTQELAVLRSALDEAATDVRFVVLEGEPGIGKTHLAEALRRLAAAGGWLTAWGRSDEGGAAPALWPWLAPLRAATERVEALPSAVTELLDGAAPLLAGQGGAMRFERFEAVAELLAQAAPIVVLLDDLQWADATSLELLDHLAIRLRRTGVLIVVTVRQLEVGRIDAVTDTLATIARRAGSRRVILRGLAPDQTAALLLEDDQLVLGEQSLAAIHARADGNPFYALELARLAAEDGGLGIGIPAGVGDVVRRRLTRLPAATVELLGMAAVVGRDVDLTLLARLADARDTDIFGTLEPAVAHRLLVDVPGRPGTLRFTHAIVREVLLDGLTSLRRARVHLQAADAMESAGACTDDVEILAEHLWRAAAVGGGGRAATALERAADVAISRVAYAAAEQHLTRAVHLLRVSGTDDRRELAAIVRLLEVTGATRNSSGTDLTAIRRGQELADRLGEEETALQLLYYDGVATVTGARMSELAARGDLYRQRTLHHQRPQVRASGEMAIGIVYWMQGRLEEAAASLQLALELFGPAVPEDAVTAEQMMMATLFDLMVQAMRGTRSMPDTFATFELLADVVPPVGVPPVCTIAVDVALLLDQREVATSFDRRVLDADPSAEFMFWGAQLVIQRGLEQIRAGALDTGLAAFAKGVERYRATGGRSGVALFLSDRAAAVAGLGRPELAEQLLVEAWAEQEDCGEQWCLPYVHTASARVALASGDRARAAGHLATAVTIAEAQTAAAVAGQVRELAAEVGIDLTVRGTPPG